MAIPKMTLKIELIYTNGACIKLIQVSDIYTKSGSLLSSERSIYTKSGWMFYIGTEFKINKRTKIVTIPLNPHKEENILYFNNDMDRKELLKELHTALLQWSGDKLFKDKKVFDKTPRIRYHKDIWIIF